MLGRIRRGFLAAITLLAMANVASAQVFHNAPWNRGGSCPGGVCPTSVNTTMRGHWTYPGTINGHLASEHGVDTSGMSREEMLDVHDAIHEGRAPNSITKTSVPYRAAAYAVQSVPMVVKSGGSSGGSGLRVGSADADGYIITSIGSTVAPEIAKVGTGGEEVQQLAIGDRVQFRKSLLEAARRARQSGAITAGEYFLISAASRNPKTLEKMQAAVHEAAIEEGLATTAAIDWQAIIDFLEQLIPIIIKLIDLFS